MTRSAKMTHYIHGVVDCLNILVTVIQKTIAVFTRPHR